MNDIKIFEKEEFGKVRMIEVNDEPMFCLSDVCVAIGLQNPSAVKDRLDKEDVQLIDLHALNSTEGTIFGNSKANFITETGLYDVLLQSSSPSVKPFRKWVTKDVLPSIRKHGLYATDNTIDMILNNPDFGIELLTKLKEERSARVEAEKTVAILTHTNKTYTCTEVAKEIGLKSAKELNSKLHDMGIQYQINGTWLPYTKYSELAWFDIKQEVLDNGHIIYHRRITGIGRKAIIELIKNKDE